MNQIQRSVLIIEDNPDDRATYRRYLLQDEAHSYTILEATLAQEGLALWRQHHPDIVLVDYRLPDLDGLAVLAQLNALAQQSSLSVIMLTGMGNEAIAVQAIKAGAQDYLVKGQITSEQLRVAINRAIETVQLQNQLQERIESERVISRITRQIHQILKLDEILQTTVDEVRQFLRTDRVLIFRLQSDGCGMITTESVSSDWTPLLSTSYCDPCFTEFYVESFRRGLVTVKSNIHDGSINPCHVDLLANLQVRANLVVPILQDHQLWGMLIVHHCHAPRQWQRIEIDLLQELATHVGIALQQAELHQQAQDELAERRRIEVELLENEAHLQQLAENLQESRAQFQQQLSEIETIYQSAPVGLNVMDTDLRFIRINQRLAEINGLPVEAHVGQTLREILPNLADAAEQLLRSILESGEPLFNVEIRGETPAQPGVQRVWLEHFIPLKDGDRVIGISTVCEEITERIQAESDRLHLQMERDHLLAQERSARSAAEQANRIKDEFLAVLSHELRSPLNPILGWTRLLRTRKMSEAKTNEALATIERNAQVQAQLIEDLLDISRIMLGKLALDSSPISLASVITAAMETVRLAAEAKKIQIEVHFQEDIRPAIGDSGRLQQVIWNLLSNAVKFTPDGGKVDIYLEQVNYHAQMRVKDTGKGISPEFLPYVFEHFQQQEGTTTRRFGGLGLGLAIARQIVELHGGRIGVESSGDGQGCTFIVDLPLLNYGCLPEDGVTDLSIAPPKLLPLDNLQVLIVDDEPDSRDFIAYVVEQAGAEVIAVGSAIEALRIIQSKPLDILLSDIGMPDMDGYMLLQAIRSSPVERVRDLPAIALTGYAGKVDRQRTLSVGFQEHLSKPIQPDTLIAKSLSLLRHSRVG